MPHVKYLELFRESSVRGRDERAVTAQWHHRVMAIELPVEADLAASQAERRLLRLALDLGAGSVGGPLSPEERRLLELVTADPAHDPDSTDTARMQIAQGADPLGEALLGARSGAERRSAGAFYTPPAIVGPMVKWALGRSPSRVVDAGCGSGRFACAVARREPRLDLVAVDLDPVATLVTRANLAALGVQQARVVHGDYTALTLEPITGTTAFIGNPPYVRHHDLSPAMKAWAADAGRRLGHPVSSLSGLHTYFFLATALLARSSDFGTFITSSEWLDVGYGSAIRELLLDGLGGLSLTALDPRSTAFKDVMTTAVIVSFEAGARPDTVRLAHVQSADELGAAKGFPVSRQTLAAATRWSPLLASPLPDQQSERIPARTAIRLGEIARVHRGQVTGANRFFVLTRKRAAELGIAEWCRPAITAAEDVLDASGVIRDTPDRKVLLCPPRDLDREAYPALDRYLSLGEHGEDRHSVPIMERYVPRHRSPWWHLGKIPAPPIVASYMARRAPAFALNPDRLALLNIGHGLWPRTELDDDELEELVSYLNEHRSSFRGAGRTYHGGLEKFEPREMEALNIPAGERFRR